MPPPQVGHAASVAGGVWLGTTTAATLTGPASTGLPITWTSDMAISPSEFCFAAPLSGQHHPTIQRRGATLAAAAGPDPERVGHSLDCVTEADFVALDKAGQTHAHRFPGACHCFVRGSRCLLGHRARTPVLMDLRA